MLQVIGSSQYLVLCPPPLPTLSPSEALRAGPGAATRLQHTPHGPPHTLVLGAGSQTSCDELRAAVEGALRVLGWALRAPWVLPGGGAWQMVVASRLRVQAKYWWRRDRGRGFKVCLI
jgi:hypothetical protein